jgi:hypothetical protein
VLKVPLALLEQVAHKVLLDPQEIQVYKDPQVTKAIKVSALHW